MSTLVQFNRSYAHRLRVSGRALYRTKRRLWISYPALLRDSSERRLHPAQASARRNDGAAPISASRLITGLGRLVMPLVETLQGNVEVRGRRTARLQDATDAGSAGALDNPLCSATYQLVALNAVIFLLSNCFGALSSSSLRFEHAIPLGHRWWQFLSSGLLHSSFEHLAQTTFFAYIFGRAVERRDGALGVWLTYGACVLGANALASWALPTHIGRLAVTSLASSAGVFGLFVVGLFLPRLARKLPELLCLTPFVVVATMSRYSQLAPALVVQGVKVGHVVHLAGAFAAACFAAALLNGAAAITAHAEAVGAAKERAAREATVKERERRAAIELDSVYDATTRAVADLARRIL